MRIFGLGPIWIRNASSFLEVCDQTPEQQNGKKRGKKKKNHKKIIKKRGDYLRQYKGISPLSSFL